MAVFSYREGVNGAAVPDCTIEEESPDTPGDNLSVRIGGRSDDGGGGTVADATRGRYGFDLSDIPSDYIVSACPFAARRATNNAVGRSLEFHRSNVAPVEATDTWNSTDGGDLAEEPMFASVVVQAGTDGAGVTSTIIDESNAEWLAIVQDAITNRSGILAITIKMADKEDGEVVPPFITFTGGENGTEGNRPILTVTAAPPDTGGGGGVVGGGGATGSAKAIPLGIILP